MIIGSIEQVQLNDEMVALLRRCVLMQPLQDDEFQQVVNSSRALQLSENSVLFEQGDALTDIYLLISGGVKIQRLAPNGDEKVLELVRPGQTFAEAVLFLGGARYPVSAVSVTSSVLIGINATTYSQLLKSSNTLCLNLLGKLSQRLHWMVNEVDRLTLQNATTRVVDYLLSQVNDERAQPVMVTLDAPKNVIASRLSITPETFSRTLKDLSNKGYIKSGLTEVELNDIQQLRQLCVLESS
jgi:CRP-like cAMP-binding protein